MSAPVVVVGSGPCGAMAASVLAGRGLDVLVLDAGTGVPRGVVVKAAGTTVFRWVSGSGIRTDRLADTGGNGVEWYSSQTLGGLSNYWTAAVPRYAPADFDDAARVDEHYRWPVTYADLVEHYERAEHLLTVTAGAPIPGVPANVRTYRHEPPDDWGRLAAAANRSGHGVGPIPMAKGRPWMLAWRGAEFQSYHCVLAPLLGEGRLQLRMGARVTTLCWNPASACVDAVEYVDVATGERRTQPAHAVVLTAGCIDSTLVMLRSRSADFPTGLGNTSGLVGRFLHDHPRDWWVAETVKPLTALRHPIYVARQAHATSEHGLATSLTIGLASSRERVRALVGATTTRFGVQVFGTMLPTPDLGVALPEPDDARSRAVIDLRYDDAARRNMAAAKQRLVEVLRDGGVEARVPTADGPLVPGSSVHYAGTLRMHESPEMGVVDGWGRVHEVPNVVVADPSAFTTGPEKNPTLTAMALASRACDRLAVDLGVAPPEARGQARELITG
jgi:choline dehydrogenase-like flavoprotein